MVTPHPSNGGCFIGVAFAAKFIRRGVGADPQADLDRPVTKQESAPIIDVLGVGAHPLHMVSALATRQRLVLGQEATDAKSNEISAIPLLLERLHLSGALVTIDAMGTQTKIAQTILARGADYLLALKDNQKSLATEVALFFDLPELRGAAHTTTDGDHGRIRTRRHWGQHRGGLAPVRPMCPR